jgi:RND family efflux transporter MFP subunit
MMNKLAIALMLAACGAHKHEEAVDPTQATKLAVDELPTVIPEYPAIITTKETRLISTETGGKIIKIYVKPGQLVHKGDPIMDLDSQELEAQARKAERNIQASKADASASYIEASNAARKADIQGRLFRGGAGTKEQINEAMASRDAAGSKGASASEHAKSAEEDLKETKRLIEATKIKAEIDGEIVFLNGQEGKMLAQKQTVARVSDTSDLRVKFLVPLDVFKTLKKGQEVEVIMPNADANRTLRATIIEFTKAAESHIDVAIVEADIDDRKLQRDEVSASGQGHVRFITTEGGKS